MPGAEGNFKITTMEDFERAKQLLGSGQIFCTGNGFDVHKFTAGDHVTICGVRVAHSHALEGHSDADVGLHAITDAILGTIGAGDIGQHFPPTDARWKGADSAAFLSHAASLVRDRGGSVVHVDVTIICERPKVGPHRDAMVQRVAEILGLDAAAREREGDDDGGARIYRPARGHRRPGDRNGRPARLIDGHAEANCGPGRRRC